MSDDVIQLLPVDRGRLAMCWSRAEPLLQPLFEEGVEDHATLEDIYECLERGTLQLFLANDSEEFFAAAITRILMALDGSKVIQVPWLGGHKLPKILIALYQLERWAAECGISEFQVLGRDGWIKPLAKQGYKKVHVVLSKPLQKELRH